MYSCIYVLYVVTNAAYTHSCRVSQDSSPELKYNMEKHKYQHPMQSNTRFWHGSDQRPTHNNAIVYIVHKHVYMNSSYRSVTHLLEQRGWYGIYSKVMPYCW